jgi:hypothetical protein
MKGTIVNCLHQLVCEQFGTDKWDDVMARSGFEKDLNFMYSCDVEDRAVFRVIDNVCAVLGIRLADAADAFGDYWVNIYAKKIYRSYFAHFASFKEFVLGLNDLHARVTADIPNAQPPRFMVADAGPRVMRVSYISSRGLIDFVAGLLRGVGKYFKVDVDVIVLSDEEIEVCLHE